jgi:hypothetical protein
MGHITVWACGDIDSAIAVCTQLRLLGCKARVHDHHNQRTDKPMAWRWGPRIIVGDGEGVPRIDPTGASDLLVFGEASRTIIDLLGGRTTTRPPGLTPAVRTLTCRCDTGVLGPRHTHFPVDAPSINRDLVERPRKWEIDATENNGHPAVLRSLHSVICLFTPRGASLVAILDRITRLWGVHRTDPTERAINRAMSTATDHVPRAVQVVLGYSGGLTSSVSAYILKRAVGERVMGCFVWTGLQPAMVSEGQNQSGVEIRIADARRRTVELLNGTTSVQERRRLLSRIFHDACTATFPGAILSQGATYDTLLRCNGKSVGDSPGNLAQPLENLTREEVVLIAKHLKLKMVTSEGSAAGYADVIRGPFSRAALELCYSIDRTLNEMLAEATTPRPGVRVRPRFTLDVWEEYPRVTFGFEESEDGVQWKRMRLRDAGLDMVVEALRHDTRIHNLEVAYDVTKALN